jgi:hypothetical protein
MAIDVKPATSSISPRKRYILYLVPWLLVLSPLLLLAPRGVWIFPAGLWVGLGPSPEWLPLSAAVGWILYAIHAGICLRTAQKNRFLLLYGILIAALVFNTAQWLRSLFALSGLR